MSSNVPRKAILLAAGYGTRMAPLSHDLPKAMMPLWGVPLIEHTLNALHKIGITDVLVNLHHNPQPLLEWALRRHQPNPRVTLSFEPTVLGTGGALRRASHFMGTEPLWMINTDIAFDAPLALLARDFQKHRPLASLWMHDILGPRTVEMSKGGAITHFQSASPGSAGTFTFCGVQIVDPAVLRWLPKTESCSIVDAYQKALSRGIAVRGICLHDSYWADLGTPTRYLQAHRDVNNAHESGRPGSSLFVVDQARKVREGSLRDASVHGIVAIGQQRHFPGKITLNHAVVWQGATLTPGSRMDNSIAGRKAIVRGHLSESTLVCASRVPREAALERACRKLAGTLRDTMIETLPARGSDRSFVRLMTHQRSGILIRYDDRQRPENARYAALTQALTRAGIRVPRLLLAMPDVKALLLEDVGTTDLQTVFPSMTRRKRRNAYRRVLQNITRLHRLDPCSLPPLESPFTHKLYQWEHDLFITHFLCGHLGLPRDHAKAIARTSLQNAAKALLQQPTVIIHRDLQSSNVMLDGHEPVLIDYQGMRLGAAAYDLASLLCDPYVMLDERDRLDLLDDYCRQTPDGTSIHASFPAATVQRLAQALGAFARLSAQPDTQRFARFIPPAMRLLKETLGASLLTDILEERNEMH